VSGGAGGWGLGVGGLDVPSVERRADLRVESRTAEPGFYRWEVRLLL